jgi:two-component system chemotaxis response regulator CheB
MANKIKVLIVDDSALIRELLSGMLTSDTQIEVIGKAIDAYYAIDKIKKLDPDVLTLDIEMPKVNGLVFLEKLMKSSHPLPVIVISSLTEKGSESSIKALELGAVDCVAKPKEDISNVFPALQAEIIEKIKIAASTKEKMQGRKRTLKSSVKKSNATFEISTDKVIALGASTGGVEAITAFLRKLPDKIPPVIIVQHMPERFVHFFAQRLNSYFDFEVKVAEEGDILTPNTVFIAPGGIHTIIKNKAGELTVIFQDTEPVHRVKPAVDLMFESIADAARERVIGIILTGMGKDGAEGLLKIKKNGGYTVAQNEDSCVVFGMPKEAVRLGAVDISADIEDIARIISEKL